MDIKHYQEESRKTAKYPSLGQNFVYPALAVGGEAGELLNEVKKIIREENGIMMPDRKVLVMDEMGDVHWYLSQLATELGIDLDEVLKKNLEKTQNQYGD